MERSRRTLYSSVRPCHNRGSDMLAPLSLYASRVKRKEDGHTEYGFAVIDHTSRSRRHYKPVIIEHSYT